MPRGQCTRRWKASIQLAPPKRPRERASDWAWSRPWEQRLYAEKASPPRAATPSFIAWKMRSIIGYLLMQGYARVCFLPDIYLYSGCAGSEGTKLLKELRPGFSFFAPTWRSNLKIGVSLHANFARCSRAIVSGQRVCYASLEKYGLRFHMPHAAVWFASVEGIIMLCRISKWIIYLRNAMWLINYYLIIVRVIFISRK